MATTSSAKQARTTTGDTESTTKKPVFKESLFLGAVEGELRAAGIIPEGMSRDDSPAFFDAIGTWSATLSGLYAEVFDSAVDAANAFADWLETSDYEYQEPQLYRHRTFTVTLTMQAASGEISVSMMAMPDSDDSAAVIAAMKKELQSAVAAAFPRSERQSNASNSNGKRGDKSDSGKIESVDLEMMRVEKRNGRLECRLIPSEGKWTQYGVALYPEMAKELDIDIPRKPGEYSIAGEMTYECKPDGRPSRVIGVENFEFAPED